MATVYSLVCWGGGTGKTVTLTDAGDIVNSTNHGLRDGTPLQFASGTMPSGLALNTTYYSKSTGINAFTLYTTDALTTQVTWTGAGTGPFVLKSKAAIDYLASPPTSERWGTAGAERCYDGAASWTAAISSASEYDSVVAELGHDFTDQLGTASLSVSTPAANALITTKLAGYNTSAYHGGTIGSGYMLKAGSGTITLFTGVSFYGFSVTNTAVSLLILSLYGINTAADAVIVIGNSTSGGGTGVGVASATAKLTNSLVMNNTYGVSLAPATYSSLVANNIFTKNGIGVYAATTSSRFGCWYNNISVGNVTANWSAQPTNIERAAGNAGLATDIPWKTGTNTGISIDTSDFYDYANNDLHPALSSSPQVDQGVAYYGVTTEDIADSEVPSYNNGGAEAVDIGCYEFDHGFGPHPASTTVTFQGVNAGSEIRVYDGSANDLAGVESCTADPVLTWNVAAGQQRIVIIHPDYRIKEFNYNNVAGSVTIPVQQEVDRWFSNP